MNVRNREQWLGLVGAAMLAILLGDRLVLTPLTRTWKARAERIADLRRSVEQGIVLLDREKDIRERWQKMRTNTLSAEISVAESQVLKAFDGWSQDSGVSISSIRPQWKRGGDDSMNLECRADVSGSLSSLTRFLYLAERDPLALKVDAIELTTRDNQAQQLTLGMQVSGLVITPPRS